MKYIWLFLLLFFWANCSKGPDVDIPGEPVFTASFDFNSTGHLIQAGVEDVYLFTSHQWDSQNLRVFKGTFTDADCPAGNCPGSLTFEFRNLQQGETVSPDSLFFPGERSFFLEPQTVTGPVYRMTFSTPDTLVYHSFQWRIDHQGNLEAGKSITRDFQDNTDHIIELYAYRAGALKSVASRTISTDTSLQTGFLRAGIAVSDGDSLSDYTLTAQTAGSPVLSYAWNTGETTEQIMPDNPNDIYRVKFTGISGDTAFAWINGVIPGLIDYGTAEFSYKVETILPDVLQPGRVSIRWVDENGISWESEKGEQPDNASFIILDSEPYENNENGENTRKMTVSFSCLLFNADNPAESRQMNGTTVLAVAYP